MKDRGGPFRVNPPALSKRFAKAGSIRKNQSVKKAEILSGILEALRNETGRLLQSSRDTRAAGNDSESKAEGKYDTRSTEDNYLADGLARQAQAASAAAEAYLHFAPPPFGPTDSIDLGALVDLEFVEGARWFFLGPAGGGIEVTCAGKSITVLTPDSPLGRQVIGLKAGGSTEHPKGKVRSVF